jgi:hypothetical protein
MTTAADLEERRALLVSRCELDRIELALAWHDVKRAVYPDGRQRDQRPSWIGRALGFAIPLVGAARARRLSRYLSLALFVYRVATTLRGGAR